ncbi:MAG: hypothetical protein VB144_02330 [Clostridia bacterium]|nr:hypothetical protein [Clostridia bacterium]
MGVSINEAWNKTLIPHVGGHCSEYYSLVAAQLNEAYRSYKAAELMHMAWTADQMRTELQRVVSIIQQAVISGKVRMYKWCY